MDLEKHSVSDAAEAFARYVHNQWGVGQQTHCGDTGALLFLSDHDRAIYISRGSALDTILTDRRLDQTIHGMKKKLQKREYSQAIVGALQDLDRWIERGEPQMREILLDFLVQYGGLILIGGMCFAAYHHRRRQVREYARVASQLNALDQARAEALRGQFRISSCPICLEEFQKYSETGSDGKPLRLLRCGHAFDETCWSEWVASGRGAVDKCPICQQDVGPPPSPQGLVRRSSGNSSDGNEIQMRRFRSERNFRLARLQLRYPEFVRDREIQRWTDDSYEGQMARDQSFVNNDPRRGTSTTSTGGDSNGNGFGGGSSSGGRGGRW